MEKGGDIVWLGECLSSKHETHGSVPNATLNLGMVIEVCNLSTW